jgi:hypothetical protein
MMKRVGGLNAQAYPAGATIIKNLKSTSKKLIGSVNSLVI